MVEKEAQRKLPEEFFKDFICLLLERKEGREKETGEKHQCVVASHTAPAEDLARNPGMCPDWESNWRPFGSQASTRSTEPHQPGLFYLVLTSQVLKHNARKAVPPAGPLKLHFKAAPSILLSTLSVAQERRL